MAYVAHDLGKTFYRCKGQSRKKIPLVCLHGGPGGRSDLFKPLLKGIADRRVYIYDQIGAGRSSTIPKKHWKIKTFVDELNVLLDAWGVKKFHLLGASWGTTLALEYYLRLDGKGVQSLIFQSPMFCAADWQQDAEILIQKLPEHTRRVIHYCHEIGATDAGVYKQAMREYYLRHVLRDEKKLNKLLKKKNHGGARIYEYMWGPSEFRSTGTLKDYDRVAELETISVPTLIICGQYDEAMPITGKKYAGLVPDSRFVEIPDASHCIVAEQPEAMIDTVNDFLNFIDN